MAGLMRRSWLYFVLKLSVLLSVTLGLLLGLILVLSGLIPASSSEIAFMARQSFNWNLYVLDLDRQLIDRLTFSETDDRYPAWSPDGKQLAFHSNRDGQIYDLYVMNADGRGVRQLTNRDNMTSQSDENFALGNAMAAWSPDGEHIAFHSDLKGDWDLYVLQVNDGTIEQLTDQSGDEVLFAWSPDGQYGLFSMGNTGNLDTLSIFMIDMQSRTLEQLTFEDSIQANESDDEATEIPPLSATATALVSPSLPTYNPTPSAPALVQDWHPSWSPDGQRMVFASEYNSYYDNIYMMNLVSGEIEAITNTYYTDHNPIWSGDGRYIVFASDRNIVMQIFAHDLQNGRVEQISHLDAEADAPAWRPN